MDNKIKKKLYHQTCIYNKDNCLRYYYKINIFTITF